MEDILETEVQQEESGFIPAPEGSLYATVDKNHKLILINQVEAFEKELPAVEFEQAWDGSLYEKGYAPAKSNEVKAVEIREVRDAYLNNIEWRVSRYRDQIELGVQTTDTDVTYMLILQYMQYLRDYPSSTDDWYDHNPLTLEQWQANQ